MTDHIEDDVEDTEYDETVGLDENDLRVTHRAAFMILIPEWDGRITREERGEIVTAYTPPVMETAFQHYKASMAVLDMINS